MLIDPLNPILIIKKPIPNPKYINIKIICVQILHISLDKIISIKNKLTIFTD